MLCFLQRPCHERVRHLGRPPHDNVRPTQRGRSAWRGVPILRGHAFHKALVELCRMAPLLRVFFHTRLVLALHDFCPRWRVSAVTGHEICILHGHDLFGVRLGSDPFHVPAAYPCASIELTGEITPRDVALLLARGITRTAFRMQCLTS